MAIASNTVRANILSVNSMLTRCLFSFSAVCIGLLIDHFDLGAAFWFLTPYLFAFLIIVLKHKAY